MNVENLDIVFVLVFSVFSIFILEWILLGFWKKICWSVGIPIFFKRFAFKDSDMALKKIEEFVNSFGNARKWPRKQGNFFVRRKPIKICKKILFCMPKKEAI